MINFPTKPSVVQGEEIQRLNDIKIEKRDLTCGWEEGSSVMEAFSKNRISVETWPVNF